MKDISIIVNPTAGKGKAALEAKRVEELLRADGVEYDLVFTTHMGHAIELARQAAEAGCSVVAAMGGDGTANEVINGLMQAGKGDKSKAALAVLSAGRGNDFAFGAGAPGTLEEDCHLLKSGVRRTIDVGRVYADDDREGRWFGNGIGIGFDTMVGLRAAEYQYMSGFPGYLVAALSTLYFYFTPPLVRIVRDGEEITQQALMISVMNGQRMGGGFFMAPQGDPADGKLDYCIVSYGRRLRLLQLILKFTKGAQEGEEEVAMGRASSIEITALEGTLPVHADGETVCREGKKIRVEIQPAALDVIVAPESAYHS